MILIKIVFVWKLLSFQATPRWNHAFIFYFISIKDILSIVPSSYLLGQEYIGQSSVAIIEYTRILAWCPAVSWRRFERTKGTSWRNRNELSLTKRSQKKMLLIEICGKHAFERGVKGRMYRMPTLHRIGTRHIFAVRWNWHSFHAHVTVEETPETLNQLTPYHSKNNTLFFKY